LSNTGAEGFATLGQSWEQEEDDMTNSPSALGREGRVAAIRRNEVVSVRYQVADLDRAITFYTERLGFALDERSGGAFAAVSTGNLRLILSGPGSSGARPMPDGQLQQPGGWSRILVYVADLEGQVRSLEAAGVPFRNTIETGPGGSQILIEDPDGNPIELHQPPG
jgi:catechol 2,3-dioxygenase-like lactoylglutathione lyase family enzyme